MEKKENLQDKSEIENENTDKDNLENLDQHISKIVKSLFGICLINVFTDTFFKFEKLPFLMLEFKKIDTFSLLSNTNGKKI